MAQLALNAQNQAEVTSSIARGMEILGPSISLDTLVTALVIRVGTLSGVHRLESLCSFAVMSVIVNYVVFMTFYPACLSLILELTRNGVDVARSVKARGKDSLLMRALYDEDQKPNPVVQRVKIIMSTGLIIVHAHRYIDILIGCGLQALPYWWIVDHIERLAWYSSGVNLFSLNFLQSLFILG